MLRLPFILGFLFWAFGGALLFLLLFGFFSWGYISVPLAKWSLFALFAGLVLSNCGARDETR